MALDTYADVQAASKVTYDWCGNAWAKKAMSNGIHVPMGQTFPPGEALPTSWAEVPAVSLNPGEEARLVDLYISGSSLSAFAGLSIWDVLWHSADLDCTIGTSQTVNSLALPARDAHGESNGEGCSIVMFHPLQGAIVDAISVSYTNSAGVSGRTGTLVSSNAGEQSYHNWEKVLLQAGDTGVQSIQSVTVTDVGSNQFRLAIARKVASRPALLRAQFGSSRNDPSKGTSLPYVSSRLYDGTVLVPTPDWSATGGSNRFVDFAYTVAVG